MAVTLAEFREHFARLARGRFLALVSEVMVEASDRIEDLARANARSRLRERSRELITSIRAELREEEDSGVLAIHALAGGQHGGADVPYARVQEEGSDYLPGGVVRPRNARLLAIPVGPALTGRGLPRYPSARMAPRLEWRPVGPGGRAAGLLVHTQTGEVWYVLTPWVRIHGVHYLLDAVEQVAGELPDALSWAAEAALDPEVAL